MKKESMRKNTHRLQLHQPHSHIHPSAASLAIASLRIGSFAHFACVVNCERRWISTWNFE
jgi:hypothetical protein